MTEYGRGTPTLYSRLHLTARPPNSTSLIKSSLGTGQLVPGLHSTHVKSWMMAEVFLVNSSPRPHLGGDMGHVLQKNILCLSKPAEFYINM